MDDTGHNHFVTIVLLLTVFFWGSSFAVGKYAMEELSPLSLATMRFGVGAVVFRAIIALQPKEQRRIDKRDWPLIFVLASFGITLLYCALYRGIKMTAATNASLISATSPLLVAVLSAVLNKELLSKQQIVGFIAAYAGVVLSVSDGSISSLWQYDYLVGHVLVLLSALCWALYTVLGRKITRKYPPLVLTGYITIIGAICLLPLGLREGLVMQATELSLAGWLSIFYLATFCTVVGYGGWYYALSKVEATQAAVFQYVQPLFAIMVAAWLLHEHITWHVIVGAALIISGLSLASGKKLTKNKSVSRHA